MPTVDELLRNPATRGLTLVAGPWDARPAGSVAIVDAIADLGRTREGAVALLTPSASSGALGYQLDVALATAGERRLAALAIYGAATTSVTAIRLADRTRVALLTIDAAVDLTDLAFGLARLIRADPGGVMNRALDAMRAVAAAEPDGTEAVLEAAVTAVGSTFALRPRPAAGAGTAGAPGVAVPVVSDGRPDGWVVGERDDHAAMLTAHLVAGAIGRIRTQAIKAARRPAQARADAIGALLAVRPAGVGRAAERARDVGVRLDGELAVARIELRSEPDRDLVTRRAMDEDLDDLVLEVAEGVGVEGEWYRARVDEALLLIHAGPAGTALPAPRVLSAARDAFPTATFFCGVGEHGHGAAGLRESATQAATAAAAARGWGRPGTPVHIGAVGLPPLMVDWLGTPAAQDSAGRLLGPLVALGGTRADTAIRTLQVYLDERGSLVRAGERLHLHNNAVAYRMRGIRAALVEVDLDDPDRRLELQLACRAWLLTPAR